MKQAEIKEAAYNFAQVFAAEADEIKAQCELRSAEPDLKFDGGKDPAIPDRFGLAFSGGGIRSACVALGIVQSLARAKMLNQVHYISGISGGGYLLGWLTAWISRQGSGNPGQNPRKSLQEVENQLGCNSATGSKEQSATPPGVQRHVEPYPLHYLRRYTSYLAPRAGLLSGDTLAMASIYLRNVLLNQSMLACVAVALMLVLQFPAFLNSIFGLSGLFCRGWLFFPVLIIFAGACFAGIWRTSQSLCRLSEPNEREAPSAAATVILSGIAACAAVWLLLPSWYAQMTNEANTVLAVCVVAVFGIVNTLVYNHRGSQVSVERGLVFTSTIYVLAWVVAGLVGFLLHLLVHRWLVSGGVVQLPHSYAVFGLPVFLIALSLISYLWVGIMGNSLPDSKREWLARAAGYFLFYAILFGLIFSIAFYGPLGMHLLFSGFETASWKKYLVTLVVPGGWLFTVIAGLLGARSAQTDGESSSGKGLDILIKIAPPVFLLGVLLLMSWGTHALVTRSVLGCSSEMQCPQQFVPWADWRPDPAQPSKLVWAHPGPQPVVEAQHSAVPTGVHWYTNLLTSLRDFYLGTVFREQKQMAGYFLLLVLFLFLAAALAWRLNVNEFSLHLFYRNRLVRAFLGASRPAMQTGDGEDPRNPSTFTGFAFDDDVFLKDLTAAKGFQGPYPIWGTCLNLTTGENLAWQQRKGASFIYSPLFCGWDYINRFKVPHEPEQPQFDLDNPRTDLLLSVHEAKQVSQANLAVTAGTLSSGTTQGASNILEPPNEASTLAISNKATEVESNTQSPAMDLRQFGYRSTRDNGKDPKDQDYIPGYGGDGGAPLIGTAMAASGAAVSPNWGYHSQPAVAALLTLFNLRLGWWTGNPRHPKTWNAYAPPIGYLAAELFGEASDKGRYVYLSDGGHFENLGIYELVRRRVRLIICSDADADPDFAFGDLGNAIDHCRRDFGVEIRIGAQRRIAAAKEEGFREAHYAVGEIVYPEQSAGQTKTGLLLYIKSSLTSDEPSDVLGMKAQNRSFPHDTTLNQFFNESMFESYRALGQHMMEWLIDNSRAVENAEKQQTPAQATAGDRVREFHKWLRPQCPRSEPQQAPAPGPAIASAAWAALEAALGALRAQREIQP